MTLSELKATSGEGFVKYYDMLRILKQCKNNDQKALLLPIFISCQFSIFTHPITLYNLISYFMANDRCHEVT